jgi:D-alanyl-D-alanine carboxypeptidase (penicillin-binding protein 5/6)
MEGLIFKAFFVFFSSISRLAGPAFAALLLCVSAGSVLAQNPPAPVLNARAWLLVDLSSAQVLASQNAADRVEPASLTKLMTAYLTFSALKAKTITLEQQVPVSEKAWKAVGSRMFIEPKKPVTVGELIRGMIVQSGNDACVALAELIAGSEEAFAAAMNREALRLGLKNTSFRNSTGLPDPQHFSTAEDLARLATAIIRDFPEYYAYYSQKEYTYNGITQSNRNRLLWLDPNVDGMKTGFTDNAGYCLISSAKRGPRRLLSVVLGAQSESSRATESQKLLNFGFLNYDAVRLYEKGQAIATLEVWKGGSREVKAGFDRDLYVSVPRGQAERAKATLTTVKPLVAPLALGQTVGTIRVTVDGREVAALPVLALEKVEVAGVFGRAVDTVRLWFTKN